MLSTSISNQAIYVKAANRKRTDVCRVLKFTKNLGTGSMLTFIVKAANVNPYPDIPTGLQPQRTCRLNNHRTHSQFQTPKGLEEYLKCDNRADSCKEKQSAVFTVLGKTQVCVTDD